MSDPAPLRNEGRILLTKGDLCAPWHKTRQSPKKAPNFREYAKGEVRRIPFSRTSENPIQAKFEGRTSTRLLDIALYARRIP